MRLVKKKGSGKSHRNNKRKTENGKIDERINDTGKRTLEKEGYYEGNNGTEKKKMAKENWPFEKNGVPVCG